MIKLNDIHPLTDFNRNTKQHIRRLKRTGRPEVLTVNGEAEVVVQSAEAYQTLLDRAELAETIAGIKRGLKQSDRGKLRPVNEFLDELAAKYASKRK